VTSWARRGGGAPAPWPGIVSATAVGERTLAVGLAEPHETVPAPLADPALAVAGEPSRGWPGATGRYRLASPAAGDAAHGGTVAVPTAPAGRREPTPATSSTGGRTCC
jgi:hypothetical protein